MKYRFLLLGPALALAIVSGCAPSTSSTLTNSLSNPNARFSDNVSELYSVAPYGTVGSWSGIDLKWKDSAGIIRALSGYTGKPVLLTFWVTRPDTGAWELPTLDSVQNDLGDSVRIVTVAEDDNFTDNFQAVLNYVTTHHLHSQVLVDSMEFAHIQYAEQVNPDLGLPETFIISRNGYTSNPAYFIGYLPAHSLDSIVRATYH